MEHVTEQDSFRSSDRQDLIAARSVNIDIRSRTVKSRNTRTIRSRLRVSRSIQECSFIVDSITGRSRCQEASCTKANPSPPSAGVHLINHSYTDTFAKECTPKPPPTPTKQGNGSPTKGPLHSTMAQCYLFDVLPPCCVFPIPPRDFLPSYQAGFTLHPPLSRS